MKVATTAKNRTVAGQLQDSCRTVAGQLIYGSVEENRTVRTVRTVFYKSE